MMLFYFVILYFCVLQANASVLKRSAQQQSDASVVIHGNDSLKATHLESDLQKCELVITKDGHVIDDGEVAFAVGGKENQVYCDATCTGSGMPPALRWYRYKEDGSRKKIKKFSSKRVYAVRTTHNRISILTISNMLGRNTGKYTCKGWLIDQGWVEKSIDLRYACDRSSFMCDGTRCVNNDRHCDGVKDCRDGGDEKYCDLCSENEFKCDGRCRSTSSFMCDNFSDCKDGADERNCHTTSTTTTTTPTTPVTQTTPTTSSTDVYDYDDDTTSPTTTTPPTTSITQTIPTASTIDDYNYEYDANTPTTTTTPTTSVTQTIPTTSSYDYNDYDDDTTSPATTTTPTTPVTQTIPVTSPTYYDDYYDYGMCSQDEFKCEGDCIPSTSVCDGISDCEGSEDEQNCSHLPCTHGFECEPGLCIVLDWKCDGTRDCPDGSDEASCSEPTSKTTDPPTTSVDVQTTDMQSPTTPPATSAEVDTSSPPQPTTSTTTQTTVSSFESTTSLTTGCGEDEFTCAPEECVPVGARCDDIPDCTNEMDEQNCTQVLCNEDMVSCADGQQCYSPSTKCDGKEQCRDGSDEKDCDTDIIAEEFTKVEVHTLVNDTFVEITDTYELYSDILSPRDEET